MFKGCLENRAKPWRLAQIGGLERACATDLFAFQSVATYPFTRRPEGKPQIWGAVMIHAMFTPGLKRAQKERKEQNRHWFSSGKPAKLFEGKEFSEFLTVAAEKSESWVFVTELGDAA